MPEAATVRLIFGRYAELDSVSLLRAELDRLGMLQNRIYWGEILHQGAAYPGQHEAIIDPELWRIVQGGQSAGALVGGGRGGDEPVAGLIVDADGNRMTPTHATKKAKRYRYYVSASLLAGDRPQAQKGMHAPAGDIEGLGRRSHSIACQRHCASPRSRDGYRLGKLELNNRMVLSPMTRSRAIDGNIPNPIAATYYVQRASAGLLITEGTQVSPQGVGYIRAPGLHSPLRRLPAGGRSPTP